MGHISGLVTDIIKEELRSGGYISQAYGNLTGGYANKAYGSTPYSVEIGSGLEDTVTGDRTLIGYDVSVGSTGQINGYIAVYELPTTQANPETAQPKVVIYDLATNEVSEMNVEYDGHAKTLSTSSGQHMIIPPAQARAQLARKLFNNPTKQRESVYDPRLSTQASADALSIQNQTQQVGVDYSAKADLRNKIKNKRKEIGATTSLLNRLEDPAIAHAASLN